MRYFIVWIEDVSIHCQMCPAAVLYLCVMQAVHPSFHNMESAKLGSKLVIACYHSAHPLGHEFPKCTLESDTPKITISEETRVDTVARRRTCSGA